MRHNFTLVEILGVTLLIAVLAGLGIAGYTYAVESSRESATKALVARMKIALENLQRKGKLPKTNDGSGSAKFVTVTLRLDYDPSNATERENRLKFGNVKVSDGDDKVSDGYDIFVKAIAADNMKRHLSADHKIVDAWGNLVYVRFPGKFNRGGFDIIAPGSDGVFGNASASTPPEDSTKYRTADGEWNCDDIANF